MPTASSSQEKASDAGPMSRNRLTEPIKPVSLKPSASLPASAKWLPMMARNACPRSREIGAQLSRNTHAFVRQHLKANSNRTKS